jgi:hypothetical protein
MSTKVRIPRPKLARGDSHHGQSLHGRELSEIEKMEQAAQQGQAVSVLDALDRRMPGYEREHKEYLSKVAAWEAAHPNRIRYYRASGQTYTGDPIIDNSSKVRLEAR